MARGGARRDCARRGRLRKHNPGRDPMTELAKLIQRFRTNRPKGARQLSLALRAITNARALKDRAQGYATFPELADVLDNIPTVSSVGEVLLNAEAEGFDIRDLWRAMDGGLNWGLAKRMLCNAKRDFKANPALSFKEHLSTNIADLERARERPGRKPKKTKRRRALGSVPRLSAHDTPTRPVPSPMPKTKPTPTVSALQQQLSDLGAAAEGATEGTEAHL